MLGRALLFVLMTGVLSQDTPKVCPNFLFIVDASCSVALSGDMVCNFTREAVARISADNPGASFAIIDFDDVAVVDLDFNDPDVAAGLNRLCANLGKERPTKLNPRKCKTRTYLALDKAREMFTDQAVLRTFWKAVIIADGVTYPKKHWVRTKTAARRLANIVEVFPFGVPNRNSLPPLPVLVDLAGGGQPRCIYDDLQSNYNDAQDCLSNIVNEECEVPKTPDPTDTVTEPPACVPQLDLCFVLDRSKSLIGPSEKVGFAPNVVRIKQFVKDFVKDEALSIGPENVRVCLISYNSRVFVHRTLSATTNLTGLLADIDAIPNSVAQDTRTNEALQEVLDNQLAVANGDRPGVPNKIIVCTDGVTWSREANAAGATALQAQKDDTIRVAEQLRALGNEVCVVGLPYSRATSVKEAEQKQKDFEEEWLAIAGNRSRVFPITKFELLIKSVDGILESLCA